MTAVYVQRQVQSVAAECVCVCVCVHVEPDASDGR